MQQPETKLGETQIGMKVQYSEVSFFAVPIMNGCEEE